MQNEQLKPKKEKISRTKISEQKPGLRIKNFDEVELGYTCEEAIQESSRCLMCKKPKCIEGCPVEIDIKSFIAYIKEEEFEISIVVSPYLKIRDLILLQQDFVKKQNDIIRFINIFTRKSLEGIGNNGSKEDPWWLYCVKTNTKLLPIFKFNMASAFLNTPNEYNNYVDLLIKEIGKSSRNL